MESHLKNSGLQDLKIKYQDADNSLYIDFRDKD
jgi:hypothetical protein